MSRSIYIRRSLLALSCGSILAGSSAAAPQLYDILGTKNQDRLGASLANAGDVDGDGIDDLLVGAPENGNVFGPNINGFVKLYSGASGNEMVGPVGHIDGGPTAVSFGYSVAGNADVDGDGTLDLIVGAPFSDINSTQASGHVSVRSGVDGTEIRSNFGELGQENLGYVVVGFGDLNGDGFDEYGAGSHVSNSDRGVARVYDGQSGTELYQFDGTTLGDRLGISMSAIGDIDGDMVDDILVGTAYDGYYAFSGADGTEIRHTTVFGDDTFGSTISRINDVTGDMIDDIAVGSTQLGVFTQGPGRLYVMNGVTGNLVFGLDGSAAGQGFGKLVASAGDWNGDGKGDIMVSADPQVGPGYVEIISGVSGAPSLASFTESTVGDNIGAGMAGLGDVNGDGKIEVAIGLPDNSTNFIREGQVLVHSSTFDSCGGITVYCNSLPNSTGLAGDISTIGLPELGGAGFIVQSSNLPPNKSGLFFYGDTQVTLPFGGGVRCVGGAISRLTPQVISGAGSASNNVLTDPNFNIVSPGVWNFQFWFRDPDAGSSGSFNTSAAIEVSFCP
ncbi:MAG: hypothetical protein ACI8X5_000812 [Planctomycetota bacterium]|jgi:hypothetical protein